jgi:hypothetical protein
MNKQYMIETGIHIDYSEKWLQIDDGNGHFLAIHSDGDGSELADRILVVVGDHFLYARGRKYALEPMKSLSHLLQSRVFNREQVIGHLDCEFSYGRIRGGKKPWEICLSTLPFKEGQILITPGEMEVLPELEAIYQRSRNLSSTVKRYWLISECTLSSSALIDLVNIQG